VTTTHFHMNPHRLPNKVGENYSTYCIRSFVGVLTRHLMEPNKCASWMLLLGLWAPGTIHQEICALRYFFTCNISF